MNEHLDAREMLCLITIVEEFIKTGDPVSSRQASRAYGVNLSSATIRNVMWSLSEKGFLEQPHSSSGRVPSDLAYRLYVDEQLKKNHKPDLENETRYLQQLSSGIQSLGVDDFLRECLGLLSDQTKCASLASGPHTKNQQMKSVDFYRISEKQVLSVLVTTAGVVKSHQIATHMDLEQAFLSSLGASLTAKFQGKTLAETQFHLLQAITHEDLLASTHQFAQAFKISRKALDLEDEEHLIFQGRSYMLTWPELKEHAKIIDIYQEMEDGKSLQRLIEDEVTINKAYFRIGQEMNLVNFDSCALVAANYGKNSKKIGSVGVIGPKRMDYTRIANLVEYASSLLSSRFYIEES